MNCATDLRPQTNVRAPAQAIFIKAEYLWESNEVQDSGTWTIAKMTPYDPFRCSSS